MMNKSLSHLRPTLLQPFAVEKNQPIELAKSEFKAEPSA